MELLLLRSTSRNFPIDLEPELTKAGYTVRSLEGLHAYISSPARVRPQVLVLEIGTLADLDRALVVLEWNEHVQPLAATRYLLLMASKNLSLGDRAHKLAAAEIAVLPQPTRNLLFKLELQTRLLKATPPPAPTRNGFVAHMEEQAGAAHRRVMLVRGPSPHEGSWRQAEGAPSGKVRWRWLKSPDLPPSAADNFHWHVDSRTAPRFDSDIRHAWVTDEDDEAKLACEHEGETIYQASARESAHDDDETKGRSEKFVAPIPVKPAFAVAPTAAEDQKIEAVATVAATNVPTTVKPGNPAASAAAKVVPAPKSPLAAEEATAERPPEPPLEQEALEKRRSGSPESIPDQKPATRPEREEEVEPVPDTSTMAVHPAAEERGSSAQSEKNTVTRARAALENAQTALGAKSRPGRTTSARSSEESPSDPEGAQRCTKPENTPRPAPEPAASAPPKSAGAREPLPPAEINENRRSAAPSDTGEIIGTNPASVPPSEPSAPPESRKPTVFTPGPLRAAEKHFPPAEAAATPGKNWINGNQRDDSGFVVRGEDKGTTQDEQAAPPQEPENPVRERARSEREPLPVLTPLDHRESSEAPASEKKEGETLHPGTAPAAKKISLSSIGPVVAESDERAQARSFNPGPAEEDSRRFLKTRHYQLMTLEQLGDRDSSWHPMGRYRVYLAAKDRYYGLKDPHEALPLWIYDGELAPEFIDEQKSWKFYDCLPIRIDNLESLPADAFESLYRLCRLEPPVAAAPEARSASVILIPDEPLASKPAPASPITAREAGEPQAEKGAWRRLKRAVREILKGGS